MARYIKAVECADIISERFNIPLSDLVDVFAEIPTADVVPKSEVAREIFEEIERYVIKGISVGGEHLTLFNGKNYAELKKKYGVTDTNVSHKQTEGKI